MPRTPDLELDHLAGLDLVEAVDAGDAVADGENLADFGDRGFLAEIRDLSLQDRGDFSGADVHQPTSFMARRIELSLVFSEASTIREPILTTRPPMMRRIDLDRNVDILAGDTLERRADLVDALGRGLLGDRHLGGDDALGLGDQALDSRRSCPAARTDGACWRRVR